MRSFQVLFTLLLSWLSNSAIAEDVNSPEALALALVEAGAGDIIRLAPGDYGALSLHDIAGTAAAPILILSLDSARPARLFGLSIYDVSHVELRNLELDYNFALGDASWHKPFTVTDSIDVTLSHVTIRGDDAHDVSLVDDGFPTGFGLTVKDVRGFSLEESTVTGFLRGIVVGESSDVTIRRNNLYALRSEGINLVQVSQVLIERNWIHDFDLSRASSDHADMIQIWTAGTDVPTTDVTVRGNLLSSGNSGWTQSIFMRNDLVDMGKASFDAMAYRNLRIEDNIIINAHLHGITVGETDGLVIENNAVLRNALSEGDDDTPILWTPRINVNPNARNVIIRRNIAPMITGFEEQPSWWIEDNLIVQDRGPSEPNYYGQVFLGMPGGDPTDPTSFAARPGGLLDGTRIGPGWLGQRLP